MKKIAIYTRVSTEEQKVKGISLHDQKQRGIEFCKRNNFDYEIFEDGGISGEDPIEKRPELKRLLELLFDNKKKINDDEIEEFYGIYVIEIDRLSRNTKVSRIIKEILISNNIKLFVSEGKETNFEDPNENLMFELKSLLSEFENMKTKVRIKSALKRNVIDGKVGGGKLIPFGYSKDSNKKLIVNEFESNIIKLIFNLSLEGKGTKVIADHLNKNNIPTKREILNAPMKVKNKQKVHFIWRDAVVYKILTNPIYKGERLFKGEIYKSPIIIDPNIFDSIQELLKKRKYTKNTTNKYFYLLKGIIYCGKCDSRMYGRKREDLSDNQYICSSQRYKGEFCGNRGINITKIENIVVDSIIKLPKHYEDFIVRSYNDDYIKNNLKVIELFKYMKSSLEIEVKNLLELFSSSLINKKQVIEVVNQKNLEIDKLDNDIIIKETHLNSKKNDEELLILIKKVAQDLKRNKGDNNIIKNIVTGIIDKIKIQWIEDENKLIHYVMIDYLFNYKTGVKITKSLNVNYNKSGYSFRFKELKNEMILSVTSPNRRYIKDLKSNTPPLIFRK
jgi:DNA invertase Pin-like site-specific DNA recombinase